MSTVVTIPAKGKVLVRGLRAQALKDLMAPSKIRVYQRGIIDTYSDDDPFDVIGIGRVRAWEVVHKLGDLGPITIRWEVYAGTGTCTSRCWNAKRFYCSCVCGGKKHASKFDWKELGHNWLEATLTTQEVEA